MTTTTITDELLQQERRYWQAIRERDVETALNMTDDPCIVAGASGVSTVDHDRFRQMMEGGTYTIRDVAITEVQSRQLTDDVVLLAYQVQEDLIVDGTPLMLGASDTSVWVRRDGRWVCALHTESVLGDAYGRDRTVDRS